MCENVTNLCINWSYTSSWQKQREKEKEGERERETNHMRDWIASAQGFFPHLELEIWFPGCWQLETCTGPAKARGPLPP